MGGWGGGELDLTFTVYGESEGEGVGMRGGEEGEGMRGRGMVLMCKI